MVRYIADSEEEARTLQESPAAAYLVLLVEGRVSHSFPLRGEVQLGREHDNAIVVADQKVSRHHARLDPIDKTFILTDLGSANGTYINGVRIAQPARLKDKDRIGLGDTLFFFTNSQPTANVIESLSAPISTPGSPPAAAVSGGNYTLRSVEPSLPSFWIVIGCMALVIVVLLFIVAMLLGLFVGRSQVGLALFWLAWGF